MEPVPPAAWSDDLKRLVLREYVRRVVGERFPGQPDALYRHLAQSVMRGARLRIEATRRIVVVPYVPTDAEAYAALHLVHTGEATLLRSTT